MQLFFFFLLEKRDSGLCYLGMSLRIHKCVKYTAVILRICHYIAISHPQSDTVPDSEKWQTKFVSRQEVSLL